MDDVALHLGNNIRELREGRGLTQAQISRIAAVPRATWANLESGGANPTLAVLIKVADALQVSLEELITPPRSSSRFFPAASLAVRTRGKVRVRRLLPEPIAGLEIERMELPPGAGMTGIPHTAGTREYLTCERGEIQLSESGRIWRLAPGDVLAFRGDQPHGYRNPGRGEAIAYSVIALAPLAG
ncbi:MAG: helix-turn-helix transcriptional regulator [Myxococcales bacterium]|nr:helix-turn-helix transcriptional regulator [Myxococcales bacterium]MCB9704077.1 helix-turn-helix transcriptional regulator [Myxococcales bacterium]